MAEPQIAQLRVRMLRDRFRISEGERVLDIGCGNAPFPLATHLCDLRRGGTETLTGEPLETTLPFVAARVEELPFEDKTFDFAYCAHVLEHVPDPEAACRELSRVARRGYVECPVSWIERVFHAPDHRWLVDHEHGKLVFRRALPDEQCDLLGIQYDILPLLGDRTFSSFWSRPDVEAARNVQFYWEGSLDCVVVRQAQRRNGGRHRWFYVDPVGRIPPERPPRPWWRLEPLPNPFETEERAASSPAPNRPRWPWAPRKRAAPAADARAPSPRPVERALAPLTRPARAGATEAKQRTLRAAREPFLRGTHQQLLGVLARPFLRGFCRRHLAAIWLDKRYVDPPEPRTVFFLNHSSWWDYCIPLLLNELVFRRRISGPVAYDILGRQRLAGWFLRSMGAFSVAKEDPSTRAAALRHAQRFLARPGTALFIYPQGKIVPERQRIDFQPGIGWLYKRCPGVEFVPIACHMNLLRRAKPQLFIQIDGAVEMPPDLQSDAATRILEARCRVLTEALQARADDTFRDDHQKGFVRLV